MSPAEAIGVIAACVESDDYTVRQHVFDRLADRHLTQPDLLALLCDPDHARGDGRDGRGRERWFLSGTLHDGTRAETLVVIDARPHATIFTIYWID